jgi:hypothetical protein
VGTQALNLLNQVKESGITSSIYKGVYFYKPTGQWHAAYKNKHIGFFDIETDAAKAYNATASGDSTQPNWELSQLTILNAIALGFLRRRMQFNLLT